MVLLDPKPQFASQFCFNSQRLARGLELGFPVCIVG